MKLGKKILSAVVAVMMLLSIAPAASAATYDADYCYSEGYDVAVQIGAEGSVLLKNKDNLLPLAEGTKVTVLGAMSYNYVEGGTGSAGGADDENTVLMLDALLEAGLDVNEDAWGWLEEICGGERGVNANDPAPASSDGWGGGGWTSYTKIHEFAKDVYEGGKGSILQDGYTDYAIVTFARSGAEGASPSMDYDGDGSTLTGSTYLELDQNEKDLLAFAKENFAHTIVLINSAAPMELGFIDSEDYNVDACLWIGHPGEAGITGVATLLSGRNNPSGRLVDTFAYDMTTNPTYYNTDDNRYVNANGQTFYQYEEGIYVGYRYYETADSVGYFDSDEFKALTFKNGSAAGYDQVVQFPFGFGLSYTTFTEEITASDVALAAHGQNSITVKVTNTGDVAGKNVVELYMDAPFATDTENFGIKGRGLEKAKVVLIGYAKTGILEPGASEEVTISFATDDLTSFDNFGQGCYVLENGKYSFNVQKDAHQWGDRASDSLKVILDSAIIYNEADAGKRDRDQIVAVNALDDVTAGDGNMVDGYLSRGDIAGGMKQIMAHQSDETPNEKVTDAIEAVLALTDDNAIEYTFETYKNGVKTQITETLYAHGSNMMPYAEKTPDGVDAASFPDPDWEMTYYVAEGQTTENGNPVVTADKPAGASHILTVQDLAGVDIYTEEGLELFDKLASMTTIDEAIEIQGNSGWNVSAVDSVGKPAQKAQDGPGEPANGTFAGATWFPCAVTIAATWNNGLARAEGVTYGHQAILAGVGVAYAPAMNIHRSPFGGRNFEYYSEDGFISGHIGGSAIEGIQATGTNVTAKHAALNDGDTNRGGNTTWANEQAIREIYLKTYEIACEDYGCNGMMGSLNRIGMTWFHYGMYKTIMRDEWGWQGLLITDGDGMGGDAYNTPVAMLCVNGNMLSRSLYIDARATVAAYGDATDYVYGRYMLHNNIRNALYQYASTLNNAE